MAPNTTPIVTEASVPNRDADGVAIPNTSIAGATTVELTDAQKTLAQQSSRLWIQGGVPGDPVLDAVPAFRGGYAFGALRCSIDNLNGDNVEWIAYPTGREHVYCFAYYVTPPPGSATVTIRKQVSSPPSATKSFEFEGNISYTQTHTFSLNVVKGNTPSATFYRAETRPGDPAWTFRENVPSGWLAPQIECTTKRAARSRSAGPRRPCRSCRCSPETSSTASSSTSRTSRTAPWCSASARSGGRAASRSRCSE